MWPKGYYWYCGTIYVELTQAYTNNIVGSVHHFIWLVKYLLLCIDDKPKLKVVFKKLLPLAKDWMTIGGLLGVERYILSNIKTDEEGVQDCLHAMLSEWLKQVDPPPTWKELVDAVEVVDLSKAKELRQHIAIAC